MSSRTPIEFTNVLSRRVGNRVVLALGPEAGQELKTDEVTGALVVEDEPTWAAINGNSINRWVNNKNGINAAPTVLTDGPAAGGQPGIYYNLAGPDEIVLITQVIMDLETLSDTLDYEIGYTDAANGAGTFTPVSSQRHIRTGTAFSSFSSSTPLFVPATIVRYSDGARSITMRVQTNDAAATITANWLGYKLEE